MKLKFWELLWKKNGYDSDEPKLVFYDAVDEIQGFETYIKLLSCPGCHKTDAFQVTDYERGAEGWEFHIICGKCRVSGVVNNTGFHFSQLVQGKPK